MPRLLEEWRVPRSCAVPSADMGCPRAIASPVNTQHLAGNPLSYGISPSRKGWSRWAVPRGSPEDCGASVERRVLHTGI